VPHSRREENVLYARTIHASAAAILAFLLITRQRIRIAKNHGQVRIVARTTDGQ
jgi:hypothetical protein